MAARLPLWYAQPRGAGLASLAVFEPDDSEDDSESFLDRLEHYLLGWITDGRSAFIGFAAILTALVVGSGACAHVAPAASALLALATIAWMAVGAGCAWQIAVRGDGAAAWAKYAADVLAGLGRIIAILTIVGTIVTVVFAVAVLLMGAAMSDRRW